MKTTKESVNKLTTAMFDYFGKEHESAVSTIISMHPIESRQAAYHSFPQFVAIDKITGVTMERYRDVYESLTIDVSEKAPSVSSIDDIDTAAFTFGMFKFDTPFYIGRPVFGIEIEDDIDTVLKHHIYRRLVHMKLQDALQLSDDVELTRALCTGNYIQALPVNTEPHSITILNINLTGKRLAGTVNSAIKLHLPKSLRFAPDHVKEAQIKVRSTLCGNEKEGCVLIDGFQPHHYDSVDKAAFVSSIEKRVIEEIKTFLGSDDDLGYSLRLIDSFEQM